MITEPNVESSLANLSGRFEVTSSNLEIAGRCFELFRPRCADDLISDEEFERDERLPYWADVWASSIVLAERIAAEIGGGRSLLELGCGLGLVAIVAASAGFRVTATDYDAAALEFTQLNVRHNRQSISATRLADWRDFPSDIGRFDMVVASDVLYERRNVPPVAAALAATIGPTGLGLVADPQRRHAADFPGECQRHGLQLVRTVAVSSGRDGICQTIDLHEIRLQLSS